MANVSWLGWGWAAGVLVGAAGAGGLLVTAADAGWAVGVSVGVMQVKNLLPDDPLYAGALPRPRERYLGQTGSDRGVTRT